MIRFEGVSKIYNDGFKALNKINLEIKEGELLVLIGPSGSGKTTTMKMINRLIEPTEGKILVNGKDVMKQNPVELRRDIGYVIQSIGLLPHLTIAQNVALVPKLKKMDKSVYEEKVDELLNLVGLDPKTYKTRYPTELSGGQQQRIGVIRALAADPPIILMDEPFSALDPISREQLQDELVKLQDEIKKTIVFVTHDMDEALKIADRVCIMRDGTIVQIDTPENILRHPKDDFVSEFIGEDRLKSNNILPSMEEVMIEPLTIKPDRGLAESLKLMRKHKFSHLLVTDKKKPLGYATLWNVQKNYENENLRIKDIMKPLPQVNENSTLEEAIDLISREKVPFIPVVNDAGEVKGIVNKTSLIDVMADQTIV